MDTKTGQLPWPFIDEKQPTNGVAAYTVVLDAGVDLSLAEQEVWLDRAYVWATGSAGALRRERAALLKVPTAPTAFLALEQARENARLEDRAEAWSGLADYAWAAMHYVQRARSRKLDADLAALERTRQGLRTEADDSLKRWRRNRG